MSGTRGKTLARLHRVRTIQLHLAHADEARARDHAASEAQLHARIAELAAAVAPIAASAVGVSLGAAAHYRDKLHQSALTAAARMRNAEDFRARAAEATRTARRDQSAIEKLIVRADAATIRAEMRALEETPPGAPASAGKRHDPC
ncbi:hypothetical protein [Sphingomonas bacterium]|uniref:hypothetical protein n=1 Tax=Sphingomonas bacterium TaxID=1895847 RepID=UPI0015771A73|nr:hypothetical protein [Sphingomonas bacterium]